ncbi:hypothetical protein KUCAC02_007029, partial [Chaenocephalus aceratus]
YPLPQRTPGIRLPNQNPIPSKPTSPITSVATIPATTDQNSSLPGATLPSTSSGVAGSLLDHAGALDPADLVLHPTEGPPMMKGHPKVHQIVQVHSEPPSGQSLHFPNPVLPHHSHGQTTKEGTGLVPGRLQAHPDTGRLQHQPHTNPTLQLDCYPGAKVYHFMELFKRTPPIPTAKIVIISIGINNKDDDPERTTTKQLNIQTRNILTLNNFHNTLPTISPETFRTGQDNIHWTPPPAQLILDSWCRELHFETPPNLPRKNTLTYPTPQLTPPALPPTRTLAW